MLKYFFLTIVCLNFSSLYAQQDLSAYYKMLHGEWKSWGLGDASAFYRPDSIIDIYLYGEVARAATAFQVEVDTISPWKPGERKYALDFQNDTLMIRTYPANEGFFEEQQYPSQILVLNDSVKISVSLKRGKGIKDHIDGVGMNYKFRGTVKSPLYSYPEDDLKAKFILPDGFAGYIVIMYDQEGITNATLDELGRRILHIPASGLLETNYKVDPIIFATRQYAFYYNKQNKGQLERLPLVWVSLSGLIAQTSFAKEYLQHFDPEAICVMPFGYNQFARGLINKKFGKDLKGNAEMYYVGKLKDMIGKAPVFIEE